MEDGSCCGKVIISYLGAAFIALVLLIDVSTAYGEGPGEAMVTMFPETSQIVAVAIYILTLLAYPLLPSRPSWIISVVAFAAAGFTAGGIAVSLVILPILSGLLAVLYLSPAGFILFLSAIELFSEVVARKETN